MARAEAFVPEVAAVALALEGANARTSYSLRPIITKEPTGDRRIVSIGMFLAVISSIVFRMAPRPLLGAWERCR